MKVSKLTTLRAAGREIAGALCILFAVVSVSPAEENNSAGTLSRERGVSSSPASISGSVLGFFQRLGEPERKALTVELASSYTPNLDISSVLGSVAAIYDHGYLWDRVRSGNTALKLEAVAGSMFRPYIRTVASVNMMSLYYPQFLLQKGSRTYLEAGIGAIFTDYRVEKQPYRFNFNPQLGIGTELHAQDGGNYFFAVRLHHISNGSTNKDNQGINSLVLQLGRFF